MDKTLDAFYIGGRVRQGGSMVERGDMNRMYLLSAVEPVSFVPFFPLHDSGRLGNSVSIISHSKHVEGKILTESITPYARYTTVAAPIPTPKPSAKPKNVQASRVPTEIPHSSHASVLADSQTASRKSSIPKKSTRAEANTVGIYGRRSPDVRKRMNVRKMTRVISKRPPFARVKKTE